MDLVTPTVEEIISDGEKECEENGIGKIKRERECVGSFWGWCRGR